MVNDPYPTKTITEVLALLSAATESESSGVLTGWRDGESSAEREHRTHPRTLIRQCRQSLAAKDPDTYPPHIWVPITRTRVASS